MCYGPRVHCPYSSGRSQAAVHRQLPLAECLGREGSVNIALKLEPERESLSIPAAPIGLPQMGYDECDRTAAGQTLPTSGGCGARPIGIRGSESMRTSSIDAGELGYQASLGARRGAVRAQCCSRDPIESPVRCPPQSKCCAPRCRRSPYTLVAQKEDALLLARLRAQATRN
jgi:hypothetical protein